MARQLVGSTLTQAIQLHILGQPKAVEAISAVDGAVVIRLSSGLPHFCDCLEILEGRFPGPAGCWPLQPNVEALAEAWIRPEASFAELQENCDAGSVAALRMVEAAAWEVCQAITALVRPIALGLVQAHGQAVVSGASGPIAREAWRSPLRSFDLSGRLGEVRDGRFEPDWMDVYFAEPGVAAEPAIIAGKSKGGRPPEWRWDDALYAAFCRVDRDGIPKNGTVFCNLVGDELDLIHKDRPDLAAIRKKVIQRNVDWWRFLTNRAGLPTRLE